MARTGSSSFRRVAQRQRKDAETVSPGAAWDHLGRTPLTWKHLRHALAKPLVFPPAELWLVRHGETTTNAQGLITGAADAPLTARGQDQAHEAGRLLSGERFDVAWSSTLRRSTMTLDAILDAPGTHVEAQSVRRDERLDERSLGEMELTETRPVSAFARGDLTWAPPKGESYELVAARCLSFLVDVARLAETLDRPTKLLVCSHVGPMRILAGTLRGIADPARVLKLHYDNSVPTLFHYESLTFPPFVEHSQLLAIRIA